MGEQTRKKESQMILLGLEELVFDWRGMFRFCSLLHFVICTDMPSPRAASNGARVSSVSYYDQAIEAFGGEVERRIPESQRKNPVISREWVQKNSKGNNFLESEWWGI